MARGKIRAAPRAHRGTDPAQGRRAPISCLFLGDTRLGEGRTISLPRSTLTGAAAKLTAPPIPGTARKDRSGPATDVAWLAQGGEGHRAGDTARWWRCRARDLGRLDQDEPRGTRPHPGVRREKGCAAPSSAPAPPRRPTGR